MARRVKIVAKLDNSLSAYRDKNGRRLVVCLPAKMFGGEIRFKGTWHLECQEDFDEFANLLEITEYMPEGKIIIIVINNGCVEAIGDVTGKRFFWTAAKSPDRESRFLTDAETRALLSGA